MPIRYADLLALALAFYAGPAAAQSLCAADETIVWSCGYQDSSYAVCASKDVSKNAGYLQYRETKSGEMVLRFPDSHTLPAGLFEFVLLPRGATLFVANAGYLYEMHEGLVGAPSLTISKAGKSLSTVQCTDSDHTLTLTETINLLKAVGVGE